MSTYETLLRLEQAGRLVEVVPLLGGRRVRRVYGPPELVRELEPGSCQSISPENAGQLRAWIDGFTGGRRIVAGSGANRHVDLKRLYPASDEVWELRKRDHPSTRIFGRFAATDVFVATNIRTVEELFAVKWLSPGQAAWPVWRQEIRRCKAVWRAMFMDYQPVRGGALDDYISNAIDAGAGRDAD